MFRLILCLSCALGLALPAAAQQYMANTPQAMVEVARIFGTADIDEPDDEGRPLIFGTIDGINYGILAYGCEDGLCDDVEFFASFTEYEYTQDFLNEWNGDQRFGTVYQRDDGGIVMHYSANLDMGVSQANFEDTFDFWAGALNLFLERLEAVQPNTGRTGGK